MQRGVVCLLSTVLFHRLEFGGANVAHLVVFALHL
jgi:hypothetical protein